MYPRFSVFAAAVLLTGTVCSADVPNDFFYLIESPKLKTILQSKSVFSKLSKADLAEISEYRGHIGGGCLYNVQLFTPTHEFILRSSLGSFMPPPDVSQNHFSVTYNDKLSPIKSITIDGELLYTDDKLEEASQQFIQIKSMPNTFIHINSGWRNSAYAFIVVFVNAKH